ncbi:ATP-dependent helicase/nuclease subunit [Trichinella spiralis]|uniref:ATP-dependent helicase/nuclease subunit n=1 Tax=Trichinella spiralis TaxID=6334 RepID=A0ABR3K6X5_TRISP
MLSTHPGPFTLCEDAFYTALRRTTLSSSPWQDEVERLFSLRNHRSILSSQCEDAFYTLDPSPWQDEMKRSFSLRNHRIILSSQCEDAFYTSWTLHPGRIKWNGHSV